MSDEPDQRPAREPSWPRSEQPDQPDQPDQADQADQPNQPNQADPAAAAAEDASAQRTAWTRLVSAFRPRVTRGHLLPAVLCAVLGFAVVVQVRSTQDAGLEGLRQTDLVRILDDVSERAARLRQEARDLEDTRARLTVGSGGSRAALQEAQDRARVLGVLAGTLPATGPGVEITISDPKGEVGPEVLLDTLQELRDAGAEAAELSTVDGPAVRIVASTSFVDPGDLDQDDADGANGAGVVVDGIVLTSPYRFLVIGDPRTLAAALDIPGGVLDVLRQKDAQGVVTQRDDVDITSLRAAPSPRYARPAADGDGSAQ
jgi:uncharacterized protein YlxW (UPF0749 family)